MVRNILYSIGPRIFSIFHPNRMALELMHDYLMLFFSLQHYSQEVCKDGRPRILEELFGKAP